MSDITLTFAADESAATEAFSNVGEAATSMGDEVTESTGAFDSVGEAAAGLRSPVRGLASTFRGVNSTMDGFGKIAEGDVMGGLQSMAMGVSSLVRGLTSFLIPALSATVGWLKTTKLATIAQAAVSGVVSAATKVWAGIQAAFNFVMAMNPVVLIIAAIIILIGVIVLIATKTDWFQRFWKVAWRGIQAVISWWWDNVVKRYFEALKFVWDKILDGVKALWRGVQMYFGFWRGMLQRVVGWVSDLWNNARNRFNRIVDFVRGLPSRIRSAASGMFNGIRDAFRSAINWIIDRWNSLSFGIPRIEVLGVSFGGQSFSVPQIPRFHQGVARVPGAPGTEMLAVLQAGERVIPAGGSDQPMVVQVYLDSRLIIEKVRRGLKRNESFRVDVSRAVA